MASLDQLHERAFALPVVAFLLLTPPVLLLFNLPDEVFGFPILFFYAFVVWIALLVLGRWMGSRLSRADQIDISTKSFSSSSPQTELSAIQSNNKSKGR